MILVEITPSINLFWNLVIGFQWEGRPHGIESHRQQVNNGLMYTAMNENGKDVIRIRVQNIL